MALKFYTYAETIPDNIPTPVFAEIRLPIVPIELPQKPETLPKLAIRLKTHDTVYSYPPLIKNFLEPALPAMYKHFTENYYNSRMLRLRKYDGQYHTEITYFFHHWLIHHNADTEIYRGQTVRDALEDILIEEITVNNESIFPNGLGANVLIITSDDYIIVPKRSGAPSIAKNKYAPSLSFGMRHVKASNIVWGNIRLALVREYAYDADRVLSAHFLGSFRNLYTMGSPELYFVMKIDENVDDLEVKLSEENKEIEAISAENITANAETLAYEFDPDRTSEHLYALLFLIDYHKEFLEKII